MGFSFSRVPGKIAGKTKPPEIAGERIHWMNRLLRNGLLITVVLVLASCGPQDVSEGGNLGQVVPVEGGGSYVDVTPRELASMMKEKDFFFVNVHVPYEGEIPETDAFVPFDDIFNQLQAFPQDRDAKVVLYCRSGSMSAIAARSLVQAGFTNVFNVDGGFRAWSQAGYEFIQ
jgi:rhodanese-related sulfurtransferase